MLTEKVIHPALRTIFSKSVYCNTVSKNKFNNERYNFGRKMF